MNILLDTCVVLIDEKSQSRSDKFNYENIIRVISDKNNSLYISPFTYSELFFIKGVGFDDLNNFLERKGIKVLSYEYHKSSLVYSNPLDIINAEMIYSLTEFLNYFVLQVIESTLINEYSVKRIDYYIDAVNILQTEFYKNFGNLTLQNSTSFMKKDWIKYIIYILKNIFSNEKEKITEKKIREIISSSDFSKLKIMDFKGKHFEYYNAYARELVKIFKTKLENKASKITLSFSFVDLLNANATMSGFYVITTDYDLCKFLYKYAKDSSYKDLLRLCCNSLSN